MTTTTAPAPARPFLPDDFCESAVADAAARCRLSAAGGVSGGNKKVVFLGMPCYAGPMHPEVIGGFFLQTSRHCTVVRKLLGWSLLANCFNMLWCVALNLRTRNDPPVTHFAMLHADIAPEPYWLDVLAWEMDKHDADVISAVVPIKSPHGVTSTAIPLSPDDPWRVERRVTMHELESLPETFDAADCGAPGRALLINSGCWLARLDRPWAEQVCFTVKDKIVRREEDGVWEPLVESEDWNFGRQLHALGCRVLATKKVKLKHHGHHGYPNWGAWGAWEHDRQGPGLVIGAPVPANGGGGGSLP